MLECRVTVSRWPPMRLPLATAMLLLAFSIAGQSHAAGYGCRVKVVGEFTNEKAIKQLTVYINGVGRRIPEGRGAALYCRGQLHDMAGEREQAIADFTQSIASNSHEAGVYFARADAYEDLGEHYKALADYAVGEKMLANAPAKRANLCWQRAVRGRPLNRALEDCNEALKTDPYNVEWLQIRGFANFRAGEFKAAIADCDEVLKDKPRDAMSLYIRGLSKRHLGDSDGGEKDIAAAERIDYHVADTLAIFGVKPDPLP